jgi:glycosyltransferase involved in cell wall biosynthesis
MITAVIPAYNEEKTIAWVVEETKKYVDKVIVVDDASTDDTNALAKKAGAFVIKHDMNKGLGTSLKDGFKEALKNSDIIITLDADAQHEPRNIPKFIKKIDHGYEFVLGQRDLRKYPLVKKMGNFFLNAITNFISGTHLKDTESGFRAFKAEALKKFYLKSDRYQIATEIIFEVGHKKLKACNVPIHSPVYVKGVGVIDGIKNFFFLMHRKDRNLLSYIEDIKYVLRKWL